MSLLMIWDQQWYIVNTLIQIPLAKQTSTPQMSLGIGMKREGEHGRILTMPYPSKKKSNEMVRSGHTPV